MSGDAWQVVSAGDGAKGPRLYEWALQPLTSLMIEDQRWRQKHQAQAKKSHYKQRMAKYKHLQL